MTRKLSARFCFVYFLFQNGGGGSIVVETSVPWLDCQSEGPLEKNVGRRLCQSQSDNEDVHAQQEEHWRENLLWQVPNQWQWRHFFVVEQLSSCLDASSTSTCTLRKLLWDEESECQSNSTSSILQWDSAMISKLSFVRLLCVCAKFQARAAEDGGSSAAAVKLL